MPDFVENIKELKTRNQRIEVENEVIIISTTPLNGNLISDYLFLIIVIFLSLHISEVGLFLTLIMQFFVLGNLWQDFATVNLIQIFLKSREISVKTKNPIKRIFNNTKRFHFSEIESFTYLPVKTLHSSRRYQFSAQLKDRSKILITDFATEVEAKKIKDFFESIL
ncbi:MAG TPA: hypothetical protein PKM63_18655 [Panacibacter sp.]|nr:hypothetical protein [Panacibacter sp.]HNP46323.1 hypothetical protein [Panacibacter sp.]